MAKYNFKQAALLGRGKPGVGGHGYLYSKGVHEIKDEKHLKDPTFLHFEKHGLISKFVEDKQKELDPASSNIAKVSSAAAKSQLEPDAEIGGDEPDFGEDSAPKKGKRK